MKRTFPAFILVSAFLLLGACSTTGTVQQTDLMHHHWNLSAIDGVAVAADSKSDLEIGENLSIHGLAGCNRFFGTATLEKGILKAEHLGSTLMACLPETRRIEDAVLGTLTKGAKVQIITNGQQHQLKLTGPQHTLTYQLSDYM